MKILFLDIDGVLNSHDFFEKRHNSGIKRKSNEKLDHAIHDLDKEKIVLLKKIVDQTQCKIVLSSSWRRIFPLKIIKNAIKIVSNISFKETLIDITPDLMGCSPRGEEIQLWLNENLGVEKFCIIDDDTDMIHLKKYFFKTEFKTGLTEEIANKIIEYFNNGE